MSLRRFAAAGAALALAAGACSSEAATTVEREGAAITVEVAGPSASPSAVSLEPASDPPPASSAVVSEAPAQPASSPVVSEAPARATPTSESPVVVGGSVIELTLVDGELVGGARRESVSLGEEVAVRVSGAGSDHVHVHGYDLFVDLVDGAGELTFTASIPGVFEIELEDSGTLLVQMEVK